MKTYSAPTVVENYHDSAYNACCTIDCSNLPASDWAAENADPNHRGILSQTIMQTHRLYLFIMRRYFWNLFRNCGSKNTPSICSKIFKKSLQSVFIRGVARLRRTRVSFTYVPRWLRPRFHSASVTDHIAASKNSVSLTFHGPFASLRSSRRPKTVNFGYGWPIMVSKVTKNGTQLVQKTHKLWSKQYKKRTASLLLRGDFTLVFTRVQPQILYNFWCKT